MKTTLKRGIGRGATVNGNGRAVHTCAGKGADTGFASWTIATGGTHALNATVVGAARGVPAS